MNWPRVWEADCSPSSAAPWCTEGYRLDGRPRAVLDLEMTLLGDPPGDVGLFHLFWNWIGRSQEEIVQARRDWMEGTRFGEVKGYDGAPLPAPALPPVPLKPHGRAR